MNAKQRYNARRAAKNRESKVVERRMITAVATAMLGCSERSAKALTLIDGPAAPRQAQEECGAMCLPQVALFNAGHRKTRKDAVHIIK